MAATALDVSAIRARFSSLELGRTLFDAPGGTQVPDSVVAAITNYLRESNANLGGAFGSSRRSDRLVTDARLAAAGFLGCTPDEVIFGQNMTTLNFALSRTAGRELAETDEIVVTRLDHDANISPWLELAADQGLTVKFADILEDTTLNLGDLERLLTDRTRIVAFPLASNAVGTLVDAQSVASLAHEAGALAWADAVHLAPHAPIDVEELGVDVAICSPYKFFGPHLGLAFARAELLERWPPYKVRPAPDQPLGSRHETGTLPHELLAGFVAAVDYVASVGWDAIRSHEQALGEHFLSGLPEHCRLYGLPTMHGRVPTFAFTVADLSPSAAAEQLAARDIAVWHGNYYALEVMQRLGLPEGAVRVGIVHYNTEHEVGRLLASLAELS